MNNLTNIRCASTPVFTSISGFLHSFPLLRRSVAEILSDMEKFNIYIYSFRYFSSSFSSLTYWWYCWPLRSIKSLRALRASTSSWRPIMYYGLSGLHNFILRDLCPLSPCDPCKVYLLVFLLVFVSCDASMHNANTHYACIYDALICVACIHDLFYLLIPMYHTRGGTESLFLEFPGQDNFCP